ncbi:MAG: agmatinase [Myxococcota bacterium]|nr:agmatinase [Myxococcota bacterium]
MRAELELDGWRARVPVGPGEPNGPLVLESPVAAGEAVLELTASLDLAAEAGPDGHELLALLGAWHACAPTCRLTRAGLLVALTELPAGELCTVDLGDSLWSLPDDAPRPRCLCGEPGCPGEARGFGELLRAERQSRLAAGRALPWLVARELATREAELIFLGEEAGQSEYRDADTVVLPAPLEATVSYGHGTAEGPAALLEASNFVELYDEETEQEFAGRVHTLPFPVLPPDAGDAVEALRRCALGPLRDGKLLLVLGGEHSLSPGPIAAAAACYPGLGVLHLDAHLDLRAEYEGTPYSHASAMRRVVDDLGLPVVSVGIRSFSAAEARLVKERGYRPFYAHACDDAGDWIAAAIDRLPAQVYLTLDLDVLDPAELPGTGTPEPGGLRYREVLALLRALFAARQVVGADLVELAPIPGSSVSQFLAARLAEKIVAYRRLSGQQG